MHWAPVPLAVNDDPRVRACSPVEQLALVRLYLIARGADVVLMPPQRTGEAPHAVWRRIWGAETADAVGGLVTTGLVAIEPAGLRLVIATSMRSAPRPASAEAAPADSGNATTAELIASRTRKLRFVFNNRTGELSDVAASLSWETWLATDHGQTVYARRVLGHAETTRSRNATGTFRGRSDGSTGTPQERHGNASGTPIGTGRARSEESSFTEEEKERERENARGTERNGTPAERNGTERHGNALDALRDAAAGHATLTGTATMEQGACALLARHALSADEVARMGAALATPAPWWPKGKNPPPQHVTLNDLAGFRGDDGHEWRPLAALVAHVRTKRGARPAVSIVRAPDPVVTPEEHAKQRAGFRAVREAIAAEAARKDASR